MAASACVTIPNVKDCTVAGVLAAGGMCAETQTGNMSRMDFREYKDWLEPQPERPDPANPGKMLPRRAGAICRSADDYRKIKDALEGACRELGSRCTYEVREAVQNMTTFLSVVEAL